MRKNYLRFICVLMRKNYLRFICVIAFPYYIVRFKPQHSLDIFHISRVGACGSLFLVTFLFLHRNKKVNSPIRSQHSLDIFHISRSGSRRRVFVFGVTFLFLHRNKKVTWTINLLVGITICVGLIVINGINLLANKYKIYHDKI